MEKAQEKKQTATLEEWFQFGNFLGGKVYDHPQIKDGTEVRTSKISWIDTDKGQAETRNTLYKLGAKRC